MAGLDAAIIAYREALEALRASAPADAAAGTIAVILARDTVAQATSGTTTPEVLTELARLDGQLQAAAPVIVAAVGADMLMRLRASAGSPPSAWWWALDEIAAANEPKPWIGWAILAGLLHHTQRQFHRRNLNALPRGTAGFLRRLQHLDSGAVGLVGRRRAHPGRRPVDRWAARPRGIGRPAHARWRTALAFLVLVVVLAFRLSLPIYARTYNDRGVRQQQAGRITSAIDSYERAISLAPDFALAHYNLGSAYDDILQYDKALVEYQTAIQNDPQIYFAYNNLARLYMLQKRDYVDRAAAA